MKAKTLFTIVVLLVIILSCLGIKASLPRHTQGDLDMIQPCGMAWCSGYDQTYSQVNLNNSQANENNAQADKLHAQATAISNDTNVSQVRMIADGFRMGVVCVVGILVILGVLLLFLVSGGGGND